MYKKWKLDIDIENGKNCWFILNNRQSNFVPNPSANYKDLKSHITQTEYKFAKFFLSRLIDSILKLLMGWIKLRSN